MKTRTRLIATGFALAAAFALPVSAVAQDDLLGGWIVTGWTAPDGTEVDLHRGLFLFTASGQYSIMFVAGDERPAVGDDPSEATLAAAYGPFIANSGRYLVDGNTITYEAFVSKDPAYMMDFAPTGGEGNEQTIMYSISDGTLTFEFGEGGPMGGSKMTLTRPGGGD